MFTVEHGAMKAGPTSVMLGVSHMMNKVIQHQVDFLCGDGNQATSTILSKQQEADFHNSMLATAARAALGAFNEGKWLHERVGFEFFDNNPYELTEQPKATEHSDTDCCFFSVLSWGHCAAGHHARVYALSLIHI